MRFVENLQHTKEDAAYRPKIRERETRNNDANDE